MTDRRLTYFLVVGEEQSISRASVRLNVASSAISRQICHLEQELGVELFDRIGRQIRLSRAGEFYLEKVRDALEALAEARHSLRQFANNMTGHLKIGLHGWSGSHEVVRNSFREFRRLYPACRLAIKTLTSPEQLSEIESGLLDAGFLYDCSPKCKNIVISNVIRDCWAIAIPNWHRLCSSREIILADLQDEDFVRVSYDIAPFERLENSLMTKGVHQRVVQETETLGGLMSLIAAGAGIAFINADIFIPAGVVARKVSDLDLPMNLDFISRNDHNYPPLIRFLETLKRNIDA